MRPRPWGLALLSLTASVAVPAHAATCGREAAQRLGRWFTATPALPDASAVRAALYGSKSNVRAVAVDPAEPRRLFAATNAHVVRSDDGGCTWRTVYELPAVTGTAPDRDLGAIRSIDVARIGGRPRVLLAVQAAADLSANPRTSVVRSDDGFGGWTVAGTFPGRHHHRHGEWAPAVRSAGAVAYAAVPSPAGGVAYWRSVDSGQTWTLRSNLADTATPTSMTGFAVNPADADELWEWGGRRSVADATLTGLRYSTDGGATWTPVDPWPSYVEKPAWFTADVTWPKRGRPARVLVPGELVEPPDLTVPVLAWSGDGGRTFSATTPPGALNPIVEAQVTHLPNGDAVFVGVQRWTYRLVHRGRPPAVGDWRQLAKAPERPTRLFVGADPARATATVPTLVAFPNARTIQLLTVRK